MTDVTASELMFRPVSELASLVRSGELSARELVETSLGRIEQLEPQLNAFVDVDGERALAEADAIGRDDPRPFAGVPVAIKNNRAVKGMRLTYAADLFGDFRPDFDHNVVRRLRDAGFVVVGTTNLPEYGILPDTPPRRTGQTRNPWDTERTPGGSSGGSAAAVAAGMVPIAHGNDGGGSTRIPASCCGLVGLKPQRGRISLAPELGDQALVVDGMLTRTVAETATLLDVLAGPEVGDATWAPPPAEPYADAAGREPSRLRVALATNPALPVEVHPEAARAVARTGELLAGLGHDVEEIEIAWSDEAMGALFTLEFSAAIATSIVFSGMIAGREPRPEDMQRLSWAILELARGADAVDFGLAHVQLQLQARTILSSLQGYDVVVTPTLAQPPLPVGTIDPDAEDPMNTFGRVAGAFAPFTPAANISGQPGISLPLFHYEDGLPLGVQLMGRPTEEHVLLQVAAQLERAAPWAGRRAPVA